MSADELIKKIASSKNADEIEALKEEMAERFGIHVIADNMGVCAKCGKVEDLRGGICFKCAHIRCPHSSCGFTEYVKQVNGSIKAFPGGYRFVPFKTDGPVIQVSFFHHLLNAFPCLYPTPLSHNVGVRSRATRPAEPSHQITDGHGGVPRHI
jgi:hypothetical protein